MDEPYLIQAAKDGDLDAFNRLVLKYQDMVFNQALRMLNDEASAADAVQEAFISAYRNLRGFRGGVFKAWLMRIVTNACYDDLRRRKRRPSTPLEPLDDLGDEIDSPQWMTDPGDTPEESMERVELEQAIVSCLNGLPDDFRSVVLLVDVQGFDYNEAAQSVGKPVGTIKSRLARARLRMRDCLQSFWELLPLEFRLKIENNG
jgi:RNA polymerase sigma-70 factor (ECF subfamily)